VSHDAHDALASSCGNDLKPVDDPNTWEVYKGEPAYKRDLAAWKHVKYPVGGASSPESSPEPNSWEIRDGIFWSSKGITNAGTHVGGASSPATPL
jgi:hypothetical protein